MRKEQPTYMVTRRDMSVTSVLVESPIPESPIPRVGSITRRDSFGSAKTVSEEEVTNVGATASLQIPAIPTQLSGLAAVPSEEMLIPPFDDRSSLMPSPTQSTTMTQANTDMYTLNDSSDSDSSSACNPFAQTYRYIPVNKFKKHSSQRLTKWNEQDTEPPSESNNIAKPTNKMQIEHPNKQHTNALVVPDLRTERRGPSASIRRDQSAAIRSDPTAAIRRDQSASYKKQKSHLIVCRPDNTIPVTPESSGQDVGEASYVPSYVPSFLPQKSGKLIQLVPTTRNVPTRRVPRNRSTNNSAVDLIMPQRNQSKPGPSRPEVHCKETRNQQPWISLNTLTIIARNIESEAKHYRHTQGSAGCVRAPFVNSKSALINNCLNTMDDTEGSWSSDDTPSPGPDDITAVLRMSPSEENSTKHLSITLPSRSSHRINFKKVALMLRMITQNYEQQDPCSLIYQSANGSLCLNQNSNINNNNESGKESMFPQIGQRSKKPTYDNKPKKAARQETPQQDMLLASLRPSANYGVLDPSARDFTRNSYLGQMGHRHIGGCIGGGMHRYSRQSEQWRTHKPFPVIQESYKLPNLTGYLETVTHGQSTLSQPNPSDNTPRDRKIGDSGLPSAKYRNDMNLPDIASVSYDPGSVHTQQRPITKDGRPITRHGRPATQGGRPVTRHGRPSTLGSRQGARPMGQGGVLNMSNNHNQNTSYQRTYNNPKTVQTSKSSGSRHWCHQHVPRRRHNKANRITANSTNQRAGKRRQHVRSNRNNISRNCVSTKSHRASVHHTQNSSSYQWHGPAMNFSDSPSRSPSPDQQWTCQAIAAAPDTSTGNISNNATTTGSQSAPFVTRMMRPMKKAISYIEQKLSAIKRTCKTTQDKGYVNIMSFADIISTHINLKSSQDNNSSHDRCATLHKDIRSSESSEDFSSVINNTDSSYAWVNDKPIKSISPTLGMDGPSSRTLSPQRMKTYSLDRLYTMKFSRCSVDVPEHASEIARRMDNLEFNEREGRQCVPETHDVSSSEYPTFSAVVSEKHAYETNSSKGFLTPSPSRKHLSSHVSNTQSPLPTDVSINGSASPSSYTRSLQNRALIASDKTQAQPTSGAKLQVINRSKSSRDTVRIHDVLRECITITVGDGSRIIQQQTDDDEETDIFFSATSIPFYEDLPQQPVLRGGGGLKASKNRNIKGAEKVHMHKKQIDEDCKDTEKVHMQKRQIDEDYKDMEKVHMQKRQIDEDCKDMEKVHMQKRQIDEDYKDMEKVHMHQNRNSEVCKDTEKVHLHHQQIEEGCKDIKTKYKVSHKTNESAYHTEEQSSTHTQNVNIRNKKNIQQKNKLKSMNQDGKMECKENIRCVRGDDGSQVTMQDENERLKGMLKRLKCIELEDEVVRVYLRQQAKAGWTDVERELAVRLAAKVDWRIQQKRKQQLAQKYWYIPSNWLLKIPR